MNSFTVRLAAGVVGGAVLLGLLVAGGGMGRELLVALALVGPMALVTWRLDALTHGDSRARWLSELLGPLIVLAAVAGTHPFLFALNSPADRDHIVHVAKAAWAVNDLFPRGQLIGWSDGADFGWPLNALYPPGASLLPAFVRVATFGKLPWDEVYALALLLAMCTSALGFYAFARRPLGRVGATIAGCFSVATAGAWFQGGYIFEIATGVWGTTAAVGLTLWSLACLPRAMAGSWRFTVLAGVFGAAALVMHPAAAMVAVTLGLARFVQLLFWSDEGAPLGKRGFVRGLAAVALSFGFSAWWWLPYAARSKEWAIGLGERWAPLGELLSGTFSGSTFGGVPGAWIGLGLAGVAVLVGRRTPVGVTLLAAIALSFVLGSNEAINDLHLGQLVSAFEELQQQRFSYVIKAALWFGIGAVGSQFVAHSKFSVSNVVALALVLLVGIPAALHWTKKGELPPFGAPPLAKTDANVATFKKVAAFLREEQNRSPFFRTVLWVKEPWDHAQLWVPVFGDGLAVSRTMFRAAEGFRFDASSLEPSVLRAQDVRFVLARNDNPPTGEGFRQVQRIDGYSLWEWNGYRPGQRAHVIDAEGREVPDAVEVVRFDLDEVRLNVRAAPTGSKLVLHRAPYASHVATHAGAPVSLEPVRVGDRYRSSVAGTKAEVGEYVVVERRGGAEWLALLVTSLSLLLVVGGAFAERSKQVSALEKRLQDPALTVSIVGGAALLVFLVFKSTGALPSRFDARERLLEAHAKIGDKDCVPAGEGFDCKEIDWQQPHRASIGIEDAVIRCVWLHPAQGRVVSLAWPSVKFGKRLVVEHGLNGGVGKDDPAHTVDIKLQLGEQQQTVVQQDINWWRRDVLDTGSLDGEARPLTLSVTTNDFSNRQLCLNVRVEN